MTTTHSVSAYTSWWINYLLWMVDRLAFSWRYLLFGLLCYFYSTNVSIVSSMFLITTRRGKRVKKKGGGERSRTSSYTLLSEATVLHWTHPRRTPPPCPISQFIIISFINSSNHLLATFWFTNPSATRLHWAFKLSISFTAQSQLNIWSWTSTY